MGLDTNGTRFLFYCKTLNVDYAQTAMVGRQCLLLDRNDLKGVFDSFGYKIDRPQIDSILDQSHGYAEELFKFLGAETVHSFDNSGYENATHLHDMNRELPERFKEQYTTVLDGGSLEHIFNFPVAIKNCMEMLRVGGHYLAITPANNFTGHGFYQFSPELYFSIFTRENGFDLLQLVAFEERPRAKWYSVRSPLEVKGRVTMTSSFPVYLLVVAKKIARAPIFETTPQQSDYLAIWPENHPSPDGGSPPTATPVPTKLEACLGFAKRHLFKPLKRLLVKARRRYYSGFHARYFRPMDSFAGGKPPGPPNS